MSSRVFIAMVFVAVGVSASVSAADLQDVADVETRALATHVDQAHLTTLVGSGRKLEAFLEAFETGDELFGTSFNALDGGGANVGQGQRYTRTPRADLSLSDQWANHFPSRATGPNAASCAECHVNPEDGGGPASANVTRDPGHTADPARFINRNTPHLFGIGGIQRLAEEMNVELVSIRSAAVAEARSRRNSVRRALVAKGVQFGFITAHGDGSVSTTEIRGVDPSLVVRPFQWKGSFAFVRDFNRDAAHNELGIQAVEIVGDDQDGDFDGVKNEMSVGDQTALTIYNSAQPRPTTRVEMARLGLIPPLSAQETAAIASGSNAFSRAACASCHVRSLTIRNPIFSEPSQNANYRDSVFPGGQDPLTRRVDPNKPVTFDLTKDQPDNQIVDRTGRVVFRLGAFEKDGQGNAIVRLFGDLKRHDMGPGLAESIDETGTGASVFLTENLWGVGSTAPYLHDGRATTLTEAILEHGGEAAASRAAFLALSTREQRDLVAFLNNEILFKAEEAEEEAEEAPEEEPNEPPPGRNRRGDNDRNRR